MDNPALDQEGIVDLNKLRTAEGKVGGTDVGVCLQSVLCVYIGACSWARLKS